ncbi:hypothetical protein Tco_0881186 [Tanacetum coccineum]
MECAIQMSLESFQAQSQAHVGGVAIRKPVAEATRPLPVVEGKGKAIVTIEEASTGPSTQLQDDTSANIICDTPSPTDAETGEDVDMQVNLEEKTAELDQDQAGFKTGKTHESQPPPELVLMDEDQAGPDPIINHVALAGPNHEPTHNKFMANLYPKHLEDAYAIRDQFFNDKSTDDEPGKLNVEAEVVSMVIVPFYQASSSISPLSTPVIDLSPPKPASSTTQAPIFTTTTLPPPPQQQIFTLELRDLPHKINETVRENVKEAVQIALQAPLRGRFRDLSEEDMKELLHKRMFESGIYQSLPEHVALYEALKASMVQAQRDEFLAEKDKSHKRRPYTAKPAKDIPMPDIANMSDSEDSDFAHHLKTKSRPDWLKPIPYDERPATPEPAWVIPTSHIPDAAKLMKSLNLSTQTSYNFNSKWKSVTKCLQIRLTRLIQKVIKSGLILADLCLLVVHQMKAACYHDFGLELLIPEHMWINDVCTYDISASYGISHSVVSIKAYSRYGYDYLKEIILRRANHQEYTIAEKDFKNLYPNDFEDLNLLLFQGHLNHLPCSDIRMLSTALNLTKPRWDAKGFEYKHNYTIIDSPRAIVFPVSNNEWEIMRFNEIYKFSDGTLINIMEALDYKVKEYKVNMLNPGMNTRFWTDKDVERSKEFIHAIERRLKTRRIFRNLECFVGGCVRDIDYRLL